MHGQIEVVRRLVQQLLQTQAIELTCDESYELLDQYAEATTLGEDAANLQPLIHQHLNLCPDCREEFEVLLRALQADTSVSQDTSE